MFLNTFEKAITRISLVKELKIEGQNICSLKNIFTFFEDILYYFPFQLTFH